MRDFLPFLTYVVLFAYLPLLFVTAKTVSFAKLRDLTFVRALSKDYIRTWPICALVSWPVLMMPEITRGYAIGLNTLFFLPLALELGHVRLFGTRVGLNTFYSLFVSNMRETREFFTQNVGWGEWMFTLALGVLPPFALARLPIGHWPSPLVQGGACLIAVGIALPFFLNFRKRPEKRKDGYILNPYVNLIYGYCQFKTQYRRLQALIARHAAPPFERIVSSIPVGERETYVVVIGESSNGHHQHYDGYPRGTNEFTDRLGERLFRFRGVHSPFSQTIPSLEKTITFADATHPEYVWTKGSVVDYFREAGFETYWMSNQYALDDTALTAMTAHADVNKCYNFSGMKRFEKAGLDGDLLSDFEKFVAGGQAKKVIFVHLIGSHSAYVNRYPDAFRYFDGQVAGRNLAPQKAQMLNSYDDSVRYTDWVVAELVRRLESVGGASYLLYFSDHGEDIYDSREDKIMGHSQLANEPMTAVPFMFWLSPRLTELRPDIAARAAKRRSVGFGPGVYEAPGYNLQDAIHTILDLSSLANVDFDPSRSICS